MRSSGIYDEQICPFYIHLTKSLWGIIVILQLQLVLRRNFRLRFST